MRRLRASEPSRSRRGFYLIGILIVLAIIAVLAGYQMGGSGPGGGASNAKAQLDRGKSAACDVNRRSLGAALTAWALEHPGETPSVQTLRAGGVSVPSCPAGGTLSIGPDGEVYCSIHRPAP